MRKVLVAISVSSILSAGLAAPETIPTLKVMRVTPAVAPENDARSGRELKAVQDALSAANNNLRFSETERAKLAEEVNILKAKITAMLAVPNEKQEKPNDKFQMADKGAVVFFKGIGEAQMAVHEGQSILRFPVAFTEGADRLLGAVQTERIQRDGYIYYVVDSKLLAF